MVGGGYSERRRGGAQTKLINFFLFSGHLLRALDKGVSQLKTAPCAPDQCYVCITQEKRGGIQGGVNEKK